MTRANAIKQLKMLKEHLKNDMYADDVNALNTAIQALEQEPKTGYISIDDVMSVFDDFMCGEVDDEGMNTFLEMLKDKAESENKE